MVSFFDSDVPLPPFYNLEMYHSAWVRLAPPGMFLVRPLAAFLYINYFALFYNLGVPLFILQAVYFAGCTLLAGLSMYYLFLTLYNHRFSRMGALIAALLYMNNPVLYHVMWRYMLVILYPVYALTPLLLVLYTRALRSHNILKYASLAALLLLCASPVGSGLPYATSIVIIFASYIAFSIVASASPKQAFLTTLKFLLVMGILGSLLQAWWIVPSAAFVKRVLHISLSYRPATGISNLDTMLMISSTASFVNLFQMQGHFASYVMDVGNLPWSSYDPTYFEPLFVALGFIAPILAVLGMLNNSAGKWRTYFGGLLVFTLFLMKGAHRPLGEIYVWLFESFSFAAAYRAFYDKFGFLLPFACAVLAGLGTMKVLRHLLNLLERGGKRTPRSLTIVLVASSLIVMLSIWAYPFWTGEIIARPNRIRAGARVSVPAYYSVADAWLQEQGQGFRMMILPLPRLYTAAYSWGSGFWGTDPSAWLFSTPTIARVTTPTSYALPIRIAELINSGEPTNSACLLGLLNVRYIMLHGDTSWEYVQNFDSWWVTRPYGISESWLRKSLGIQPGLHFATGIGPLYFYENAYALPHTYVTHRPIYVDGGLDALISQYTTCDVHFPAIILSELGPGFALQARDIERTQAQMDASDLPAITVTRSDPNHYEVHVENASEPFVLVFGESYDPDWSAEISGQAIAPHLLVNSYANAWYVKQTGSYSISIHFKPQQVVTLGFRLSGLGIFLTIAVFVMGCTRFYPTQKKGRE